MVRINDDLFIVVETYGNYTLRKDTHKKRNIKENGEVIEKDAYVNVGYYSSLESALNGARRYMIASALSEDTEYSLTQAISLIQSINDSFKCLIEKAVNGDLKEGGV